MPRVGARRATLLGIRGEPSSAEASEAPWAALYSFQCSFSGQKFGIQKRKKEKKKIQKHEGKGGAGLRKDFLPFVPHEQGPWEGLQQRSIMV